MSEKTISVVIPAYNEEERVGLTIASVRSVSGVKQVIVVDDGSIDRTSAVAAEAGALVIRSEKNRGKGEALNLGLKEATGDILLLLDADLGRSAAEAGKIAEPVLRGQADLAIGRFTSRKKGGFGLVLTFARMAVRQMTGLTIQAPLSGQRALNRKALEALGGRVASGFGVEVAMLIDLARKGLVIREVPVDMEHRETGRDLFGFLHRGRQFLEVAFIILRRLF